MGKFAKRSSELRALPPTPLDSITIRHPQGLVTPNTPSSTPILPILESPHSVLSMGKFAKRSSELKALPPTPLDLITIRHPQGLVTPDTPLSTQILPILESPHSETDGFHFLNTLHNLATYATSPFSVLAKTQSRFPPTPPRTLAHASSTRNPSASFDTILSISTTRKPSSSSPLVSRKSNLQRDRHKKLPLVDVALDGSESTALPHSISSPVLSSNGCAPSFSSKAKRPVGMRSTQLNRRSTSSAESPSPTANI